MADSGAIAIGEVINGRYEVMERLGEGMYFQVFKARDRTQNRMVSLKVLRDDLAGRAQARDRLLTEGAASLDLVHPNIARVYEAGRSETSAFIATEFVRGMTLKERVRRTAPLPLAVAVDIAIAIADALAFAHAQGFVHGDLRSHHVMISAEGQVKVTDFGVRGAVGSFDPNPSLVAVPYMSPEVAEGHPPTPASDLYAFGAILYEMLTGILPFEGETPVAVALKLAKDPPVLPSRINAGVPPALDGVVLKCLQKDPARRYRSVEALLKDLRSAQDALRFGRSLNWSPSDARSREPEIEEAEIDEIPPASAALSTLTKVLAAIVLLGLGSVIFLAWMLLFKSNPDIRVPDLVGTDRTAALQRIEPMGLVPHPILEWNGKIPEGQVYRTYPTAGTGVKKGSDLSLWVSKGPEKLQVPDITQIGSSRAVKILRDAGLKLGSVTEETNDNLDKGLVISQTPEAGNMVAPGSAIDIVKSLGPEPVEPTEPPPPPDTSTTGGPPPASPGPGTTPSNPATTGVSPPPGPADGTAPSPPIGDTTPAPAPSGPTTGDAGVPSPGAGAPAPPGRKRRFQVNVDVPPGRDRQLIQIEVTDDTGAHIRYHGSHHPGDSFSRVVSGVGDPVILRVYSDGTLIYEDRRSKEGGAQ